MQDLARPRQELLGYARQPGDVDPVGAVGAALYDLVQEDDLVAPLAHGHALVADARVALGQVGELVVVGGEEGAGADLGVDVLDDGPGQGQAVEGRGAAADLVQDDEGAFGGVVEDVRDLDHLDHEGRGAAADVVARADPGENAVDHADASLGGRHEGADLGQENDQRGLADVGGLARHVRAGQERDRLLLEAQLAVVGHEGLAGGRELDDRVAAVGDADLLALVDLGGHVAVVGGPLGEAGQDVQLGQGLGRVQDAPDLGRHRGAQLQEQLVLQVPAQLLGLEDLGLELLQLGRDVALGGLDGLLAHVLGRHPVDLPARHLEEVAEDRVEADLQAGDAGALDLLGLEAGHPALAVARDLPVLVQLGVHAVAEQPALAQGRRRGVDQRGLDAVGQVREGVQGIPQAGEDRGVDRLQPVPQRGRHRHRARQRHQVPRVGAARGHLGGQAFDVQHLGQELAHLLAQEGCVDELGHPRLALEDRLDPAQGRQQPLAQEAAAHGREGAVDGLEQGALAALAALGGDQLEAGARGPVEHQVVVRLHALDAAHVLAGRLLGLLEVLDQRPGGRDDGRVVLDAEALES